MPTLPRPKSWERVPALPAPGPAPLNLRQRAFEACERRRCCRRSELCSLNRPACPGGFTDRPGVDVVQADQAGRSVGHVPSQPDVGLLDHPAGSP